MDLSFDYQPVNTEVFEYDGTSNLSNAQESFSQNQNTSDLTILPTISMFEAMKKFNGYELTAQGYRQESSEEKIARLRREIKELEISKNDVSELKIDLERVVNKKLESGKIVQSEPNTGVSNLESRIAVLEQALGSDGLKSRNLAMQMDDVEKKLSLLEDDNLRLIDQKLSSVNTKIAGLSKHTLN